MSIISIHNHPVLKPEHGELYHLLSDPRKLNTTCPRCKEIMDAWRSQIIHQLGVKA